MQKFFRQISLQYSFFCKIVNLTEILRKKCGSEIPQFSQHSGTMELWNYVYFLLGTCKNTAKLQRSTVWKLHNFGLIVTMCTDPKIIDYPFYINFT